MQPSSGCKTESSRISPKPNSCTGSDEDSRPQYIILRVGRADGRVCHQGPRADFFWVSVCGKQRQSSGRPQPRTALPLTQTHDARRSPDPVTKPTRRPRGLRDSRVTIQAHWSRERRTLCGPSLPGHRRGLSADALTQSIWGPRVLEGPRGL